jgi:hypothetical protein
LRPKRGHRFLRALPSGLRLLLRTAPVSIICSSACVFPDFPLATNRQKNGVMLIC